jgi:hypothetical protein
MVKRPAIYTSPCTLVQVFCLPSSTWTGSSALAILHALITVKLFREASNRIRFKCCPTIGWTLARSSVKSRLSCRLGYLQ